MAHPNNAPRSIAGSQCDAAIEKTKSYAKNRLRSQFEQANAQLQGQDWLTGKRSIADPYLYVLLRWAKAMNMDLNGLDNLDAFFQRMSTDESVGKVLKAEGLD